MAVNFDIDVYENRNISFDLVWYDKDGNTVDVTGYGAIFVLKKNEDSSQELIRTDDTTTDITVGTTDGKFTIDIPHTKVQNLGIKRGVWEFVIYPTSGDSSTDPITFAFGQAFYHKTYASLS